MNEHFGDNWRRSQDDGYDRLIDLAAMAMIAGSRKPEMSQQAAIFTKQAIARRGGEIDGGRYLERDVALAVFSDVTDRAAEICLSALRDKYSGETMVALEREVTDIWRAAFDQMVQKFSPRH